MDQGHFLTYLDGITTPARKLTMQNACKALTAIGVRDHEFWIDQMMEQDDLGDATDFLRDVEDLLCGAIHSVVMQFGARLDDECSTAMSTDILMALQAMDNWEDKSALSNLAEMDDTPESILSMMLAVTGTHHDTDYITHLTYVSQSLIDRIDLVNQNNDQSAMPTREEHERAQTRLRTYFATYSAPILSQAISEMLLIGGDYKGIVSCYEKSLQGLDMEQAINELTGFALASELPNGEPLKTAIIAEGQGWWDGNTDNATKVAAMVTDRLKKAGAL
jgi:hypothetical protein